MIQIYTDSAVTSKRLKMLQSNSKYIEMIVPSNRTIYVMVYFQRFQVDVVSYELHMWMLFQLFWVIYSGICLPSMQILTRQYANFDSPVCKFWLIKYANHFDSRLCKFWFATMQILTRHYANLNLLHEYANHFLIHHILFNSLI